MGFCSVLTTPVRLQLPTGPLNSTSSNVTLRHHELVLESSVIHAYGPSLTSVVLASVVKVRLRVSHCWISDDFTSA